MTGSVMGTIFSTSCLVAWAKFSSEVLVRSLHRPNLGPNYYWYGTVLGTVQLAIPREEDDLR